MAYRFQQGQVYCFGCRFELYLLSTATYLINQLRMDWLLTIIGVLIILLGLVIWRFRLVNLLSNVEGLRVIDKEKATWYTASYLALLGVCFMTLGYFIDELSERQLILIIACFIPLNLVVLLAYMLAQSRNMN